MKEDKCCIKNCRDSCVVEHTGYNLCKNHWEEYCDWSDKNGCNIERYIGEKNERQNMAHCNRRA